MKECLLYSYKIQKENFVIKKKQARGFRVLATFSFLHGEQWDICLIIIHNITCQRVQLFYETFPINVIVQSVKNVINKIMCMKRQQIISQLTQSFKKYL